MTRCDGLDVGLGAPYDRRSVSRRGNRPTPVSTNVARAMGRHRSRPLLDFVTLTSDMRTQLALASLALAAPAAAQSPIYGVDVRNNEFFSTTTDDFVGNYVGSATVTQNFYGLDFDASATTLWAIDDATGEVATIDLATGLPTPNGAILSGPTEGLTGLTADPNGTDWWLVEYDGNVMPVESRLYRGDVSTGAFNLVGTIATDELFIDISMDSQGNLYGMSLSDELWEIDTTTGSGFVLGDIGWPANFAQGMDFDWSTDTLFATIYTGGGTGVFVELDTITGFGTFIQNTQPLNAEMEMAVQSPVGGGGPGIGTNYCVTNPNSTGSAAAMSAVGSATVADNDVTLIASNMPPMQFGIFVTSLTQAQVPLADGNLCVGGTIGRYQGPGLIQQVDMNGEFSLTIDVTAIPQGAVAVGAQPGDSWNFQAWFRDVTMTGPTSNLTDGLEITFN